MDGKLNNKAAVVTEGSAAIWGLSRGMLATKTTPSDLASTYPSTVPFRSGASDSASISEPRL